MLNEKGIRELAYIVQSKDMTELNTQELAAGGL